jgi:hypothetical protein
MRSLPLDIINITNQFAAMDTGSASFEEESMDPNEAPQPGASLALTPLTHHNIRQFTASSGHADSYQEAWLRQYRMEVDENPGAHFVSPIDTDMYEAEGAFGPLELEGSMAAADGDASETRSMASRSTNTRSRSSRCASAVLAGLCPPSNFVFRPLPLLEGVPEFTCPRCGREHE